MVAYLLLSYLLFCTLPFFMSVSDLQEIAKSINETHEMKVAEKERKIQ